MIACLRIIVGTIFSLVIFALFPASSQTYVLQGPHIIQLMTDKLGEAASLFVSQRVIFYNVQPQTKSADESSSAEVLQDPADSQERQQAQLGQSAPAPGQPRPIQLDESVRYLFSEAFRSDIVSDSNQRIYVSNAGRQLTVIDGVIADAGESRFDLYKDLLLYRSREMLCERLSKIGIDIAVTSLGKFEGHLALVIGAEFPDETVPQLWIDKQTFQPLRMIIAGTRSLYSNSESFLEIRYTDWQQIGKIWYPMQIEFVEDGITVRAIEVEDYQVNPDFSKDLFDIALLRMKYRQAFKTPDRSAETEGLSEVQKTIEEFKKIFE